ncbi:hypothetical protein L917_01567 [Phytophthora nicotianae]|uniref:Uncharacterized protein n=1 Tax=Phytophthora nicotianae TaxID=4792 RepID=W2LYY9_PHYNI|nr:hypothetical protein L917_01567 [Phytophthora nicotianae]
MRVIWISRHNYSNSDLLKLHLMETDSPETLEELYTAGTLASLLASELSLELQFSFVTELSAR